MPRVAGLLCVAIAAIAAVDFAWSLPAQAAEYVYQFNEGPRRRDFNLIVRIRSTSDDPAACALLCAQDKDNCYRVDFTKGLTKIVKVEMGRETLIGTASKTGLTTGSADRVMIKRRRMTIAVALNGKIVAEAYDETFTRGRIGVGARKGSVAFEGDLKAYDCGEVHFADDFMTTTAVQWKALAGSWSVLEASNPTLSANPFKYCGKAAGPSGAMAAALPPGSANWDEYSAKVSAKDDAGAPIGLAFYCVDPKNYHLFRWTSKETAKPNRQIVRVRDGVESLLASVDGGYIPGQWYTLRVDVRGTTAKAYVDDCLVAEAKDDQLVGGSIGLCTQSTRGSQFDDVLVDGIGYDSFEDDFTALSPGKWMELGGKWTAEGGKLSGKSAAPAKLVSGDDRWRNYVVTCDVFPPQAGAAGLAFYYQDELNYFLYRSDSTGKRELLRFFDGAQKVLASAQVPPAGKVEKTVVSNVDGLIRVAVNDARVLEAFDPGLSEGRVGICVEGGTVSFGKIDVHRTPAPEMVLSLPETFAAEKSQEVYAADQRDWLPDNQFDTNGRKWWWHRANLFGEASIELDMSQKKANNTTFELALSAGDAPSGGGRAVTGYTLTVWKAGAWQLAISREGQQIKRAASVFKDDLWKIEFKRDGKFLFGRLNQKLEIWAMDDKPLAGSRAGYSLVPPAPGKMKAEVYCPNLITYTFARSPNDWRSAAGEWEVTSRWSCDPRWSWFGGEARNGPAIIWNKLSFKGDFSIEFCAAIKMDGRRGSEYNYARDMNVTIAADGLDLTSGYSFIFGGWNNTLTCITRKDAIVAQPQNMDGRKFSKSANMHRQWWYFKIERHGGKMRWFLDNNLMLEYVDPEPLDGGRVALWAYDVGILAARVRIAAEKIGPPEPPDFPMNAVTKTIYDFIQSVTKTVNEYVPSKK